MEFNYTKTELKGQVLFEHNVTEHAGGPFFKVSRVDPYEEADMPSQDVLMGGA
jgi:hypothetical protein